MESSIELELSEAPEPEFVFPKSGISGNFFMPPVSFLAKFY